MTTITETQPQTRLGWKSSWKTARDYAVTLLSIDTDEDGIPYERQVGVLWDEGVVPNWEEWLEDFNRLEGEEYILVSAVDVTEKAG